jgi:DNA topoisomerase-1
MSSLVIVESPAKAKTIEKYLGPWYLVTASMGHIADLPKGNSAIDKEHNYLPNYEISAGKKKVVSALKKMKASAKEVILATDEDREGEAIAWHICRELNLNPKTTKRIVFHEITKEAIDKAIAAPRTLDLALVDAQQARRVLDRLVGFDLSPVLWKKVKAWLSAGRVQSVAVKLLVEREREIEAFDRQPKYDIQWVFETTHGKTLSARGTTLLTDAEALVPYLEACRDATIRVQAVQQQPWTRNPWVPFTTSTLQQEASRRFGYSPKRTMQLAQRLYESWLITYMRTDSYALSAQARSRALAYVTSEFGSAYAQSRVFTTKKKNAQEAHEAIRPTNIALPYAGADDQQKKLYHMIWQRTVASQMKPALLQHTTVTISAEPTSHTFTAKGSVIVFDGFLRVYGSQESDDVLLPDVHVGDVLQINTLEVQEWRTKPPARYTEAMLIKKMEELGIWRPSTYAPTLSTIEERGYVIKDQRPGIPTPLTTITLHKNRIKSTTQTKMLWAGSGRLIPTDIGTLVTDFLEENFSEIMNYQFTANVEEQFDHIAHGDLLWYEMIDEFYRPFQKKVLTVADTAQRVSGERILGNHPDSGKVVKVRMWRYGPVVQIGEQDDPEKIIAWLHSAHSLQTVNLDEALASFSLPRVLWVYNEHPVKVNTWRFGPYVQCGSTFASLPKDVDLMAIVFDEALPILEAKIAKDLENTVARYTIAGKDAVVKKWRRWYFVSYAQKKYALPKALDTALFTQEYITSVIGNTSTKKTTARKTTAKKTTTARKTTARKTTAKKTTVKKASVKTQRTTKTVSRSTPTGKQSPTTKSVSIKSPSKKGTSKKGTSKKA